MNVMGTSERGEETGDGGFETAGLGAEREAIVISATKLICLKT